MSVTRARRARPDLADVPAQAMLAVAALVTAVLELGGWLEGDGFAGYAAIVLLVMAGVFGWASSAAERAGDLTRRLLAFSRRAPADPRPVAIDDVLEDAFRMVRRLVPERLELELDLRAGARRSAGRRERPGPRGGERFGLTAHRLPARIGRIPRFWGVVKRTSNGLDCWSNGVSLDTPLSMSGRRGPA